VKQNLNPAMQRAAVLLERGEPFVLVTVLVAKGSAPGKPGAKLLLEEDGTFCGTIGGGAIEHTVRGRKPEWFQLTGPKQLSFDLGGELDMDCGGDMELLFEPFALQPRLVLYGAGHVAIELATLAVRVGYRVVVMDDRPEWANEENFPDASEILIMPLDGSDTGVELRADDAIIVVTRGHAHDYAMAARALREPHAYLGVIGSRRKAGVLRKKLAEEGFDEETLAAVHSPIGLDIASETPAEIAVSIVAELIATRRGATRG
jgi:xanthine dehydrogenase accessory factor